MQKIFFFTFFWGVFTTLNAQTVPRFNKINVGEKGCTVYAPMPNVEFKKTLGDDGSAAFRWSRSIDKTEYSIIHIDFKQPIGTNKKNNEALLKNYFDFFKTQFKITDAAGYGTGHTSEPNPQAVGIIDYWQNKSDAEFPVYYFVKGWVSPNFITIYMMGNLTNDFNEGYKEVFTNGFQHNTDGVTTNSNGANTYSKIKYIGDMYSTPNLKDDTDVLPLLKKQLPQRVVNDILTYAEEKNWPTLIKTLGSRGNNRDKLNNLKAYYCADLPNDKILLWIPIKENQSVVTDKNDKHNFYIVIKKNAVDIGTKVVPTVNN